MGVSNSNAVEFFTFMWYNQFDKTEFGEQFSPKALAGTHLKVLLFCIDLNKKLRYN